MLKLDYGTCEHSAEGGKLMEPVHAVARIWALRVLIAMGRPLAQDFQCIEAMRQTGLTDSDTTAEESFQILRLGTPLHRHLDRLTKECPPMECPLSDNLTRIGKQFGLSEAECAAMACLTIFCNLSWFQDFIREVVREGYLPNQCDCFAAATGLSPAALQQAMSPGGRLLRLGLLVPRTLNVRDNPDDLRLPFMLSSIITARRLSDDYIEQQCVRNAPEPECRMDDFDLQTPSLRLVTRTVQTLGSNPAQTGQILLHGRPGGGKTQLVRTLVHHLGLSLKEIPESANDAVALNPTDRVQRFSMAQSLFSGQPDTMLLFDEADQVLAWPAQAAGRDRESWDKAWLNQLIESASVPCVWIANNIDSVHPAILRRFRVVQEMPRMSTQALSRVFRRHVGSLPVNDRWLHRIAETGRVTPGLIQNAAQVAQSASADQPEFLLETLYGVLDGHCKAATGRGLQLHDDADDRLINLPYRSDWLATRPGLQDISSVLANTRLKQVRLLFHGPPGTGKTALARELSRRLDQPLISATASELLGCFVGETEANIARLFEQATEQDALLLLDEADSLLQNREFARQQWQITQVNELLQQLENYRGLFIAATNRVDALDPACLRRLDLKVRFDYLPAVTIRSMCRAVLGRRGRLGKFLERKIEGLDHITLGDFRTALRRLSILSTCPTAEALIDALAAEMEAKPGKSSRAIGFLK